MKWSWKLGQLAGIDVRVHATFLLLLGWVVASYWITGKTLNAILAALVFIVAVFACVVLHEVGHALAARKFGIRTSDITLLPIGGLARLQRMPEEPRQELWIALAGPAVNVAIGVFLYLWLILTNRWEPFSHLGVSTGPFVERLFLANVSLVLFNLIPAFPMDGGRVLRALLAMRTTYIKATQTAALVGQWLACGFVVVGLFTSPMLSFIGVFVWFGARQEAAAVQMKSSLSGIPVRAAMLTDFETLQSGNTLADAIRLTIRGSQHDFPVIHRGRLAGMLTKADLLTALSAHGPHYPVTFAMRPDWKRAESAEPLETAFERLQESGGETIPVLLDGFVVGLMTIDNLDTYLAIDAIFRRSDAAFILDSERGLLETHRAIRRA
jgi:Zn-dependent protease/CBS domain-containing protein